MKSILLLSRIEVENANAVAGLTYGFPGISNFLGFSHAVSRDLNDKQGLELSDCAIICHDHTVHMHKQGFENSFSQSRFPLLEKGTPAPTMEEGKMHMTVSLILSCDFTIDDMDFGTMSADTEKLEFENFVYEVAVKKRLAGGFIKKIGKIEFIELSPQFEHKKMLRKLLPGFVIMDRSDELRKLEKSKNGPLESWLDCITLTYQIQKSTSDDEENSVPISPKPISGWIVPLQVGFKSIAKLNPPGTVDFSRDRSTPLCFVEPIYSLGEWVGLHRIQDLESIFWKTCTKPHYYYCKQ